MEDFFEQLERSNLLNAFHAEVPMEPLPSGEYILHGLVVERDGRIVNYRHIAGDGAGGAYLVLDDGALALIDSEGYAAVIGKNLEQALSIMLSLGGLNDAWRFAGGPDKDVAQAAWNAWRLAWGVPDGPSDPAATAKIRQLLNIAPHIDPFGDLYLAVTASNNITVRSDSGGTFGIPGDPALWPKP